MTPLMPLQRHCDEARGLPALGANVASLAGALAATAVSVFARAFAARRRGTRLMEGTPREPCCHGASSVTFTCDGHVVRHHYRYCCVPRCYGCRR
jgi:hypothetical protein